MKLTIQNLLEQSQSMNQ